MPRTGMTRSLTVSGLILVVALAVAWWTTSQADEAVPALAPAAATPPLPQAQPAELRYEAPVATKTPAIEDRPRLLELPNGEFVPALNGARGAPAMEWELGRPYSPIVGRERTTELEWYVHADGTKSTTQMSFRTDLGRFDAVTTVAHPGPVGQIPPDEPGADPSRR